MPALLPDTACFKTRFRTQPCGITGLKAYDATPAEASQSDPVLWSHGTTIAHGTADFEHSGQSMHLLVGLFCTVQVVTVFVIRLF